MIHQTMIKSNNKIVVYNFMKNGSIIVTTCNHISFPTMISVSREETMVISYETDKYMLYELAGSPVTTSNIPKDEIKHIKTRKLLSSLDLNFQ